MPSVGGTMNIITKGMSQNFSLKVKQEVANNLFFRTSVGYNSGRTENGWGVTAAFSYKTGDGWADYNFTDGIFGYLKVEKLLKDTLFL